MQIILPEVIMIIITVLLLLLLLLYMFTRLILFLICKCSLHPPPLHCQTVTQKSCSQTPLKSGQGWKQQQLFRGPRPEKPLNRWKYYSYMLCYKCTVMVGNKFLLTYLLTHLLIYVYFWILELRTLFCYIRFWNYTESLHLRMVRSRPDIQKTHHWTKPSNKLLKTGVWRTTSGAWKVYLGQVQRFS